MIASLLSVLLASRNQSHIFHLQTTSYSEHKALGEYYEAIGDFIDNLAESYQGKYGIIRGYTTPNKIEEVTNNGFVFSYFEKLSDVVEQAGKEIPQDSYLLNQIDEIVALIQSTIYKLKFLK
jgi:DNA-binding ferritin-like protein